MANEGMNEPDLIYRTKEHRGLVVEAVTDPEGQGMAIVRVLRGPEVVREFKVWAYKVYNYGAHIDDIAEDIERGIRAAAWTGISG